ncbi:polyketide synthase, partial [Streptomyces sp. MCAF7]
LVGVPAEPPKADRASQAEQISQADQTGQAVRVEPAPALATVQLAPRREHSGRGQEIAIVGITGRYPQADDLDTFWAHLRDGEDGVTEVPQERWDHRLLDDAGLSRGKWGGFIDGVDQFDAQLFGIAPRDAKAMDPQQRLLLQTVWQLLEQSGVTQEAIERRYERRVGVYIGAGYQMYRADESDPTLVALTTSTSYNMIANRVSYFFGLEGPSLAVDSMCSS